jgi:hypothetical protein
MAFSEATKDAAYRRSGGRCECTREHAGMPGAPHHGGRCSATFTRHGAWEAHHIVAGGPDTLSNCQVVCVRCHRLTATYGR